MFFQNVPQGVRAGGVGTHHFDVLTPRFDEGALHHLMADGMGEEYHDVRRSDLIPKAFRHLGEDLRPTRVLLT